MGLQLMGARALIWTYWPWLSGFKSIKHAHYFCRFGQCVGPTRYGPRGRGNRRGWHFVADSVSEHPTFGAMDEAALEALEARLAAMDSQHNVHHGPSAGSGYGYPFGVGRFGLCFLWRNWTRELHLKWRTIQW